MFMKLLHYVCHMSMDDCHGAIVFKDLATLLMLLHENY